ncbi:MAG: ribosomal subunit interface protein [Rickettsiales bacterium]|nr:ribosomal subunit interface protein [Rickettsiales bacterium]
MNNIEVSGKQTKLGEALKFYVKENIIYSLTKYFKKFLNANILFSKDKYNFKCEINIHLESSIFVQSHSISNDAYGAFNIANEKIKKRIRRYHRKLVDHRQKKESIKQSTVSQYIFNDPDESKEDIENPLIIAETEFIIRTLTISEALMIMNLTEQSGIPFINAKNNRINFLYKRKDGNIGWIDPKKK